MIFPKPPFIQRPATRHWISISVDGKIKFNGTLVDQRELRNILGRIPNDKDTETLVEPSSLAPFSAVVSVVEAFNYAANCRFGLVGNEQHSEVFGRDAMTEAFVSPDFPKFARVEDLVIAVQFVPEPPVTQSARARSKPKPSGCHVFLHNRVQMDSDEMRYQAFRRLDMYIKLHWSSVPDSEETRTPPTSLTTAIIQAKSETPWKCVAGAIYNVQVSGYSNSDLVVLP